MILLSDTHSLLDSIIRQGMSHAGDGVMQAEQWVDHACDRVLLNVQHVLAERRDLDNQDYRRIGVRLRRALLVNTDPTLEAKQIRMQRRQLIARGQEAAARKPRRQAEQRAKP